MGAFATCATEGGGLFRAPQFLEKLNDLRCCTARLANDVQTIIAGISHVKMVPLRVSTILRLRDHLYAQEQMFTRRAARVALCFCVRIHGVMASPSLMLKVVFLLEVTLEGWLIAWRERCFERSEWRVWLCGRGTDVHGRHVAVHHESPRHGVPSYATTPHHMSARTTNSTRERGTLHTSSLARHP